MFLLGACASAGLYALRRLRISKYVLWSPVLVYANRLLFPVHDRGVVYGAVLFSATLIAIIQYFCVSRQGERLDRNNRVLSNNRITADSFELVIRTKVPMHLKPGQHVMIRLHDSLQRKYTPILSQQIKHRSQTLLTLRIKEYINPDSVTASSCLSQYSPGAVLDLHGPLGGKYFCTQQFALVDLAFSMNYFIQQYDFFLFAAGSGITPVYQLSKVLTTANKSITLVTCDRDASLRMMSNECAALKQEVGNLLFWMSFLSRSSEQCAHSDKTVNARLQPAMICSLVDHSKPTVVIVCGPSSWESNFIEAFDGLVESKVKLVRW